MITSKAHNALRQYGQVGAQSGVESASPHWLIQMLMEGALSRIAKAGANIKRREIALKGENISWAISIIEGLRSSLDHSHGGEIAGNLERLYDYMIRRLPRGKFYIAISTNWARHIA